MYQQRVFISSQNLFILYDYHINIYIRFIIVYILFHHRTLSRMAINNLLIILLYKIIEKNIELSVFFIYKKNRKIHYIVASKAFITVSSSSLFSSKFMICRDSVSSTIRSN